MGRRKKKRQSSAEEEEREAKEEEDEVERRGELTFSCAGKVRQSLTDRLTQLLYPSPPSLSSASIRDRLVRCTVLHIHTLAYTENPPFPPSPSPVASLSLVLYPVDLSAFLRLHLSLSSSQAFLSLRFLQHLPTTPTDVVTFFPLVPRVLYQPP